MSTSTPTPSRKLFVNLAVTDLDRTMAYWQGLGFAFNRQFTDDKAACMVLSEEAYVMWLRRDFFATFTTRQICDTSQATESLLCLSADSREAVNALIEKSDRHRRQTRDAGAGPRLHVRIELLRCRWASLGSDVDGSSGGAEVATESGESKRLGEAGLLAEPR